MEENAPLHNAHTYMTQVFDQRIVNVNQSLSNCRMPIIICITYVHTIQKKISMSQTAGIGLKIRSLKPATRFLVTSQLLEM